MRTSPPQFALSSGEISPLLFGRPDYERYQTGVETCRGFLPLRQGGATRAPGTWYRGTTDGDNPARMIDFEFARNDTLTLEFTNLKMRVWRYGSLVMDGGSPFELVTPYATANLASLQWKQSADVIYLADGTNPIQKLSRFALDNWTIAPANYLNGPFRIQNLDTAVTVQASAATGSITLTGVGSPFAADMVGTLMRLLPTDNTAVAQWVGNQSISVNDLRRFDGNTYKVTAGTNTGVTPPIHFEGTEAYNGGDIEWEFVDDGAGIVQITAFTNANSVTADVIKTVPRACIDDPTYRWAEGAWSARYGYPAALEIYDQRFVAAGTPSEPRTIWFSTVGAFEDFEPSTEADEAFAYAIGGGESQNRIIWLKQGRQALYIGALGEEYVTRYLDGNATFSATTIKFDLSSSEGSKEVRPIAPAGHPIFVSKSGQRLMEALPVQAGSEDTPLELSLPAEHLGQDGFDEIVWQSSPLRMIWLRRGSGDLAVLVYDPREKVLGWATCPVAGGVVEAMSVTTDATGAYDVLTLVVRRVIDGDTKRFVEEQPLNYGVIAGSEPITNANHLFAAVKFTQDPAQDTFSVPHLAGETVYAWTELGQHRDLIVAANGDVTLPVPVTSAIIGLNDGTQRLRTLDLQAPARDGSAVGRLKQVNPMSSVMLHKTVAGKVRTVARSLPDAEVATGWFDLIPTQVAQDQTQAFSGAVQIPAASDRQRHVHLEFEPDGAAPMTILGFVPSIEEAGA